MDEEYRIEILNTALQARIREVTEYQVNIENFTMALEHIEGDKDMLEFKSQITSLLEANLVEQRKAKVMLEVLQKQLGLVCTKKST